MVSKELKNEDEIDLKEIFRVIKRFKTSIALITLIFTVLAFVFAYFSTNVYSAYSTIKIVTKKSHNGNNNDIIYNASGMEGNFIDDELEMIRSRYIASKALEHLNIGIRYYKTSNMKTYELYKESPFIVKPKFVVSKLQGVKLKLIPIDANQFTLKLEPSTKTKIIYKLKSLLVNIPKEDTPIVFSITGTFDKELVTPWFNVTVQKLHELDSVEYAFSMLENRYMFAFIQENLKVSPLSEQGSIIGLQFEDNVPLRSAEILDAVSEAYLSETLNIKTLSAQKTLDFIDSQLAGISTTLKNSASNLQDFKSKNIVIDIGAKANLTAEKLSDLESQRFEISMQLDVLENILNYIQTHDTIDGINVSSAKSNAAISKIVIDIQAATSKRKALLVDYTELHPDVVKMSEELIGLKHTLQESIKSVIRGLKKRKFKLTNIISEHQKKMKAFPKQERELTNLTRSFLANEKIYSYLLEKRAEAAIVESSSVTETRIIDTALVPDEPIKPKRALMIVVGMILGMIFGVALAFLRNFLDNTIKTIEDIENHTDLPLYGAVPILDHKKNINPFYEALRVIRTNLQFLQESDKSKLITITSSISGEGKTTVITELAKIIAQGNKKVVVLDLDMRRPKIHEKFNVANDYGMSTLISGKHSIDEVIVSDVEYNLDIIPAGPIPPNPSELIISDRLKDIFEVLLKTYDYVLLDSPPIGLVSDSMVLMRSSDVSLVVFRAKHSKKDYIKNINRFVDEHALQNCGLILNGLDLDKKFGFGYGYGYAYGQANEYYSDSKNK